MTYTSKTAEILAKSDLRTIRRDAVAMSLGVTEGLLHQRLVQEGTSYRALLYYERKWRARHLLDDNAGASLADLAKHCGYANVEQTSRAFKAWFGKTFVDYRRSIKIQKEAKA